MAAFYCTTTRIIFVFLFIFKIGSPAQESKTLKDPGHSSKMTPSCKWPIQEEKIDVDRQVTRPREIWRRGWVTLENCAYVGKISSDVLFSILQI